MAGSLWEMKYNLGVLLRESKREMAEWRGRNNQLYANAEQVYRDAKRQLERLEALA